MRLCDRDIEAWLDEGRLSITPRPPVERINGVTVDVRLEEVPHLQRPHGTVYRPQRAERRSQCGAGSRHE